MGTGGTPTHHGSRRDTYPPWCRGVHTYHGAGEYIPTMAGSVYPPWQGACIPTSLVYAHIHHPGIYTTLHTLGTPLHPAVRFISVRHDGVRDDEALGSRLRIIREKELPAP